MNPSRFRLSALFVAILLPGCLSNSGSPQPPPANIQAFAGDGAITLTWTPATGVLYDLFYAQSPDLSVTGNWTQLFAAGAVPNTSTPITLCSLLNNPQPTAYYPPYYFTITAHTGSAASGAGSQLVDAVPRGAGMPTSAPWVPGPTVTAPLAALAYAPLTNCGYSGRPAAGVFVAVGPGAAIFSSAVVPNVAGPLSPATGNATMDWRQANLPPGFAQDLAGVAAYSTGSVNPSTPNLTFAAVGKGGAVLRSADGVNWVQVYNIPTSNNLNAVSAAATTLIAVGDGGVVIASSDGGFTWTLQSSAGIATSQALHGITCAPNSTECVAVGDGGTLLLTVNAGASWLPYQVGTNSWNHVAFGNNNANADSIVSDPQGVLTRGSAAINTWVVTDAQGNWIYNNTGLGTAWQINNPAFASSIAGIAYTSHFEVIDGAGNTYISETGASWQTSLSSGVFDPVAVVASPMGYVAVGASGDNASVF